MTMKPPMSQRMALRSMLLAVGILTAVLSPAGASAAEDTPSPSPLLQKGHPVDWWFVFKLNAGTFPGCGEGVDRACSFGGSVQKYSAFGQQFVYASSEDHSMRKGSGCAGDTADDPLGATFDQIYNGSFYYVVWNDQFYNDPKIADCGTSCSSPWGHSKGVLAWNSKGEGLVLQVSTPSWPAAASKRYPRQSDGNTLGCIADNDVMVSQHFFALKLTKDDVVSVLKALANASVVTDPGNRQIVNNGGPADIQALVKGLGFQSKSTEYLKQTLSSGVVLISKPSRLQVPPWQMASAILGGAPLRAATWWTHPEIYTTTASTEMGCWDKSLGKPGAVEIATSGAWEGQRFSLTGGGSPDHNHAKIGVSLSGDAHYVLFSDLNQQGTASSDRKCSSSQNGRGGLFYVVDDAALWKGVSALIAGDTAPSAPAVSSSDTK